MEDGQLTDTRGLQSPLESIPMNRAIILFSFSVIVIFSCLLLQDCHFHLGILFLTLVLTNIILFFPFCLSIFLFYPRLLIALLLLSNSIKWRWNLKYLTHVNIALTVLSNGQLYMVCTLIAITFMRGINYRLWVVHWFRGELIILNVACHAW